MKRMKRFLALLLTLAMAFALAACGSTNGENGGNSGGNNGGGSGDGGSGDGDGPYMAALLLNGTLGDKSFYDSANEGLTRLRDELGMTVLIATHDMDIVPLYCDYAYLLGGGKVLLEGTPEQLFADPAALRANHLRLPRIAHLMEVLREVDGLDTDRSAATIGAARREILRMLKEENQ